MTMRVEYSSNNSGGRWWLSDAEWHALELAGWTVEWGQRDFCNSKYARFDGYPSKAPGTCPVETRNGRPFNTCEGHRRFESYADALSSGQRWLGALATKAEKDFPSMRDAVVEWERVTGKDAADNGCGCCGPPHSFNSDGEYASGDDIAALIYNVENVSKREMARRLAEGA